MPQSIEVFNKIFGVPPRQRRPSYSLDDLRKHGRRGDRVPIFKAVDIDDDIVDQVSEALGHDGDDNVNDPQSTAARHASDLANLLTEANPRLERSDALRWLISTAPGRTLLLRTLHKRLVKHHTPKEGRTVPHYDRMTELRAAVAKSGGVQTLAKAMVDDAAFCNKVSETEFTSLCTEEARKQYPQDRADVAFAKYFSAAENVDIRKAHLLINQHPDRQMAYLDGLPVAKAAPYSPLAPVVSGGADAQDVDNAADAMKKLKVLANRLRAAQPELRLTEAQAFARVYEDPANRALALAERRGNRPGAGERSRVVDGY